MLYRLILSYRKWAFSSGGERFPDTEEVRSSNLLTPTIFFLVDYLASRLIESSSAHNPFLFIIACDVLFPAKQPWREIGHTV